MKKRKKGLAQFTAIAYLTLMNTTQITLYRAADDDSISDCASFAESLETARAYLDNPGFGGRLIYKADCQIDGSRLLDLLDESDPVAVIAETIGKSHPGAIGADEYAPRVSYEIRDAGYDWVRVRESYPADTVTWIFVGGLDAEPDMVEVTQVSESDPGIHYTVEELMAGAARNGHWRRSPTMLDRLRRVTYSSRTDAERAIADLCELTGDEQERYRVRGIDGPPEIKPRSRSGKNISPRHPVQLPVSPAELAKFRAAAEEEGLGLGEWLVDAGRSRLA